MTIQQKFVEVSAGGDIFAAAIQLVIALFLLVLAVILTIKGTKTLINANKEKKPAQA